MKKERNSIRILVFLFITSLLFINCQKTDDSIIETTSVNLEKIKKLYSSQFNKKVFKNIKSTPLWEKANIFFSEENQYIEIPFNDTRSINLNKSSATSLDYLLATINNNEIELNIIHYFSPKTIDHPLIKNNLSYNDLKNYSGFITKFDLNKNVLSVDKYSNGIKSKVKYSFKDNKKSDLLSKVDESCTTVTETIIVENCIYWEYESTGRIEIIECWIDDISQSYISCSEDGSGNEGYTSHTNNEEVYQIKDNNLKPCMKKILDSIKNSSTGLSGIITKFSGSNNTGFNWELKDGTTTNGATGQTSNYDNTSKTVTSTFDTQKWSDASELSWARTILHESIHAYIVASLKINPIQARSEFSDMFRNWNQTTNPNFNDIQHAEFVRNYVNDIKTSLKEFGVKKGYNLSDQFYNDMAWGGLTHWNKRDSSGNYILDGNGAPIKEETPWFQAAFPNSTDRDRILNTIVIELTKKDMNGNTKTPKGNDAGC